MRKADWSRLKDKHLGLLPDNDESGRGAVQQIAGIVHATNQSIRIVTLQGLPEGGDIADLVAAVSENQDPLDLAKDIRTAAEQAAIWTPPAVLQPGPDLVRVADVARQDVDWLWSSRIARRKLNLFGGPPELGKSFVSLDMASRISRGVGWPEAPAAPVPPGNVIILSCEDAVADTIRPRLEHAGADLNRISVLRGIREAHDLERICMFSLDTDLAHLREALDRIGDVVLVIIDPISAYLGRECNSWRDADVRRLLGPLSEFAGEYNVAVLGITHLTKSGVGSGPAIHRLLGSIAFTAAARTVWMFARHPDDCDGRRRVMVQGKNNLARNPGGLVYTIEEPGTVHWEPELFTGSAEELFAPHRKTKTACEDAADWLRDALSDGSVRVVELFERSGATGIADKTLRRAQKSVGVVSRPRDVEIDGNVERRWLGTT